MDYGEAVSDYTMAIQLKPDHVEAYIWRGIDLGELNCYQQAIDDFDRAIELEPTNGKLYFFRWNASKHLTQGDQGWEDLKTAARLGDPLVQEYLALHGIEWDEPTSVHQTENP
jgi:tetratricopeptide (TPR) repeat protein